MIYVYDLILTECTGFATAREDLADMWRAAGRKVGMIELDSASAKDVIENDASGEATKFVEAALAAEQSK